jgi:hypothetical protein
LDAVQDNELRSESDLNKALSGAFVSSDNTGSYGSQCVGRLKDDCDRAI